MRPIFVFNNISVDGYFEGPDHDIAWSKGDFQAFPEDPSQQADTILLGRNTYDLMESFWPTEQASSLYPAVAAYMNNAEKVVVTHRPFEPTWNNTTIVSTDVVDAIQQLKQRPGNSIIMLGSNNLCVQLLEAGLIDSLQLVINPVALGQGTPMLAGLSRYVPLQLTDTQTSPTGVTMLTYKPKA
jgi:dihydrofolate reductase